MKRLLILAVLLSNVFVSGVWAQSKTEGKLNAWTPARVSRENKWRKTPYLKAVRVAKNKGFDRLVFEFTGDVPSFQAEFIKPPITGTADEEIKIAGKYFLSFNMRTLPYPDEADKIPDADIPVGRLNLPVIAEITQIEWFEGDRWFVVGLKAKKLYRVQQLQNPSRLVVDFKQ